MATLLEFPVDDQTMILVQPLQEPQPGAKMVAAQDRFAKRATTTFADALAPLEKIYQTIQAIAQRSETKPAEIEVELNLNFSGDAGLVIVKGRAEAALSVKLTWR